MNKYIDINGIEFEMIKSKRTNEMIKWHFAQPIRTLDDCYQNPSETKRAIYNGIYNLFGNNKNIIALSVTSYNVFKFSIGAIYTDKETGEILGYMSITKEHNRLFVF